MTPPPQVSVVIPSFNSEPYIHQTLESVRGQTFADWELIVVDDGSTDGSPAVVESFSGQDPRIRLLRLGRNTGRPAVPRNAGVRAARGTYVAFLDADDGWHPRKLDIQLRHMSACGVHFSSTETRHFRGTPTIATPSTASFDGIPVVTVDHRRLLRKNVIPTSSVVVERALLVKHPFIEDPRYKAIEDYHCWLNIHQHEVAFSHKLLAPLVYYRLADSSISRSKLAMLRKNYMLYSEYRVGGERLGLRKYLYLGTYAWFSLADRFSRGFA